MMPNDRLQPLPRLCIVPETNAQEGIAVLFHQSFGSPLAGFQVSRVFA
jgi:hypothetical protein